MPRTETGKSLYADADAYGGEVYYESMAEWARRIDAIEAEARAAMEAKTVAAFRAIEVEARAAERARIRAAVEGLALPRDAADPTYIRGWDEARAAVLRIIDGEDA